MKKEGVLEQEYRASLEKSWKSPDMVKFCMNEISNIFRLEDGSLVAINKPTIEKKFCFDDSFNYDGALAKAREARTNENFFLAENLKGIDETIEDLKSANNDKVFYSVPLYKDGEKVKLRRITFCPVWDIEKEKKLNADLIVLSDCEKNTYISELKIAREKFVKRLNSYLKRYGLSKVRSWTYYGMA